MSKLLITESPLTFQPSLAIAIGLNEAIVLQQIHYWLNNVKNKGYEKDGYKWVYNTYKEWQETNFPFWSENTVQRIFASLEEKGLVLSIQPMKSKYDRTKYYRIDYTKLEAFEDTKMEPIDDPNLVRSLNESESTTENTASNFSPTTKQDLAKTSFEAAIFADEPIEQEQFDRQQLRDIAPKMFEKALGFSKPLPWWSTKEWETFADWVVAEYAKSKTSFGEYNNWRNEKFVKGGIANTRLRGFPNEFYDSWDMFIMATRPEQKSKSHGL